MDKETAGALMVVAGFVYFMVGIYVVADYFFPWWWGSKHVYHPFGKRVILSDEQRYITIPSIALMFAGFVTCFIL